MTASLLVLAAAIVIAAASRRHRLTAVAAAREICRSIKLLWELLKGGGSLPQRVKRSIKHDRLQEAVDLLIEQLPRTIVLGENLAQLLHLQGRISATENEWRKHHISFEEYEVSRNRQRFSLIQYCEELFSLSGLDFGQMSLS